VGTQKSLVASPVATRDFFRWPTRENNVFTLPPLHSNTTKHRKQPYYRNALLRLPRL
jgi:hypothetical protein